ncbi:MAG: hypothetical protein ACREL3_02105 [Gemmatimonadales bacterium]
MLADHAGLLSAFDGAIAAVRGLEAADLRTSAGDSAMPLLAQLRSDLERRRVEIAAGEAFDREWAGRVVRWVAGWLPEKELPLIARLGQIVRLGTGG